MILKFLFHCLCSFLFSSTLKLVDDFCHVINFYEILSELSVRCSVILPFFVPAGRQYTSCSVTVLNLRNGDGQ